MEHITYFQLEHLSTNVRLTVSADDETDARKKLFALQVRLNTQQNINEEDEHYIDPSDWLYNDLSIIKNTTTFTGNIEYSTFGDTNNIDDVKEETHNIEIRRNDNE